MLYLLVSTIPIRLHLLRFPRKTHMCKPPVVSSKIGKEHVAGIRFSFFLRLTRHQRFARDPLHVHHNPPQPFLNQHDLNHASSTTLTLILAPSLTANTGTLLAGLKSMRIVSPGNNGKPLFVVTPLAPI